MEKMLGIISYRPNVLMSAEILIWMLMYFVIYKTAVKNRSYRPAFIGIFLFIAYIHRILLPFVVSGIYLFAVIGILCVIGRFRLTAFFEPIRYAADRFLYYTDRENRSRTEHFFVILWTVIVLIQLSRINIAMDYDSLRYGLRTEYVMTGGRGLSGFFENLGFVNMVYSYPKGYELLTLPLNFGHTYGYVLCVNIWIFIAVCALAGEAVRELTTSSYTKPKPAVLSEPLGAATPTSTPTVAPAIVAAALAALIPGISNMAVTAKTDLITVLLQLIFVYSVIKYIRDNDPDHVGIGLSAIIFSYTMKPTAYIFSTVIGLCGLAFLMKNKIAIKLNAFGMRLIAVAFGFFGIIMLRTFVISGLPVAGVFTELFELMGFELRYPLASVGMPQGKAEGLLANILNMLVRALLFLFLPIGEDMDHVRMAWGGFIFAAMLISVLITKRYMRKRLCRDRGIAYIFSSFYVILLLSMITLFLLYQVDGNYYMLLYLLTVITAVTVYYEIKTFVQGHNKTPLAQNGFSNLGFVKCNFAKCGFAAVSLLMVYVTAFSGWAGAVGFTPIDLKNRGYYNHEVEYGWKNPLGLEASDRVVAFAPEPECYKIRAGVESFVDIDGSGGNVLLTDTKLNIFKEYCSFADIDYVYVDMEWLRDETNQRHVRARTLFTYMLEDGDFTDIIVTDPNANEVYFKVDKERMSVPWETEMSAELKERIAEQSKIFKELIE